MNKLPKQWKHWCQKAGLRLHSAADSYSRRDSAWYYLKGHGRVWRINCYGMLQCGDTLKEFDRWALCNIVEIELPTSLAQFKVAVRGLVSAARQQDALGWPEGRARQLAIVTPELPDKSDRYNPFVNSANPEYIARLMLSMIPGAAAGAGVVALGEGV